MADKKLILVIDDDADIVDSIKMVLEKNGFAVATALSGHDGIATALNKKPDLILCDMMMEKIDSGNKVAEELMKKGVTAPVFLLSSIGDATAAHIDVESLGFKGYFQKPVHPERLVSSIKSALNL